MAKPSEADILRALLDEEHPPTSPDTSGKDEPPEGHDVEMQDDGSAIVREKKAAIKDTQSDFYDNMVEDLDDSELDDISTDLLDLIAKDKRAREKRDKQYEEGIRRMGLTSDDTIGGASFTGSSNVVHPTYTKACVDFEARAIKELMPPAGPVREYVPGTPNPVNADKARRKAKFMNFQVTQLMPHLRAEMEQLLIQLPMGGNQYLKLTPPVRPLAIGHEWVPVDKMILPFSATNYWTAERRTHVQDLTAQEFGKRMRTGQYKDLDIYRPQEPDETKTQVAIARVEGKESDGENPDGVRVVYEVDCLYEIRDSKRKKSHTEKLSEDGSGDDSTDREHGVDEATESGPAPYLISIDETTREVVSIYRNWDERDDTEERLEWTVPFEFVPFRGAYALGLPHLIGGLAIATTGALRALLDSAHINNMPGMLKIKGPGSTSQTIRVNPTEVVEIEGAAEIDDIRKLLMPMPFSEPSATLFQLLGFLADQGEAVIRTTLNESNDNPNMPVGTTLARIEQGMVAFSAIHGRLHHAMDAMLKIIHRINATYLEDKDVLTSLGEQLVTNEDFNGPLDVVPVSDPNIFCELQRYGQVQTVVQRALLLPQVYDVRKVEEMLLKQMKLPNDGKDLLIPKPEPQLTNPVNENVALSFSRPVVAFPQQDHIAHINTHCDYFENPLFGPQVLMSPESLSSAAQHLKEHLILWYAMQVHKVGSDAMSQISKEQGGEEVDIGDMHQSDEEDPEVGQKYDSMLAATSQHVMADASKEKTIERAVKLMQKFAQQIQEMQPPPPTDPGAAAMADVKRQTQKDQADIQLEGRSLDQKESATQATADAKLKVADMQTSTQKDVGAAHDYTKQLTTQEDNQTAENIAGAEILAGKHTPTVKNGEAIGKRGP